MNDDYDDDDDDDDDDDGNEWMNNDDDDDDDDDDFDMSMQFNILFLTRTSNHIECSDLRTFMA